MKGTCRTCGEIIRSHRSDTRSAQANFLRAVRRHYTKKHPNTLSRRISEGKRLAQENPSAQDFVNALKEGTRAALQVYGNMTERQYQHMKRTMDAVEPLLPIEVQIAWESIEAFHDHRKARPKR